MTLLALLNNGNIFSLYECLSSLSYWLSWMWKIGTYCLQRQKRKGWRLQKIQHSLRDWVPVVSRRKEACVSLGKQTNIYTRANELMSNQRGSGRGISCQSHQGMLTVFLRVVLKTEHAETKIKRSRSAVKQHFKDSPEIDVQGASNLHA